MTVSLELSDATASRPHIERAAPEHPSLLDPMHTMGALFGVVNIPNVVWIDEQGTIVRPAEPGWPNGESTLPQSMLEQVPRTGRARTAPPRREGGARPDILQSGQDRAGYADAIRDWVRNGSSSEYALTPTQVVDRSQPRPLDASAGAAHFELADHLWRDGRRDLAVGHFNLCHRLQPNNWTYKRQAWSLVGQERAGGEFGRFVQGPLLGEEDDWPFESDFRSDIAQLDAGEYFPKTL